MRMDSRYDPTGAYRRRSVIESIGEMRHKLQFQLPNSTEDENGYVNPTWETEFTVWGAARDVGGKEFFEAAAQHMENITTFTIRARSGINTAMRILFQSKPYEIVQISRMQYRGDYMQIKARLMGGEGT
jgi:SPP1 family predicted phage head-tail adaptor